MSPQRPLPALPLAALAFAAVLGAAAAAQASTAANTKLINNATVDYKDSAGNAQPQVAASVTVTVSLVASAPNLSTPAATSTPQSVAVTLSYTLTGTANGPDSYVITSSSTALNVSGVTIGVPANVALGGTTLAAATVAGTTILVPYDGTNDNLVNGIGVNDTIVLNGVAYQVTGIAENTGGALLQSTLTLGSAVPAGLAAGLVIGQRKTFTVSVPTGLVTAGQTQGTQTVTTAGTSVADATKAGASGATVVTVYRPALTLLKEVSLDGTTFNTSATAAPGATLTYRITATNGAPAGVAATAVTITDTLPPYVSFVAGSGRYASAAGQSYAAVAANTLTDAALGYSAAAGKITYAPPGPTPPSAIPGNNGVLVVYFQVTIQ